MVTIKSKREIELMREAGRVVAIVYDELEKVIPGKYVKIIALPFGSPYVKTHDNFKYVLYNEFS